ncbi:MAG: DUF192 domain-containing protein, partial [Acidimicrobiia bacterium]
SVVRVPVPRPTGLAGGNTGDLVDPEVRTIVVDGRSLTVAWADTYATRTRGLMQVEDLGDLDGMLFDLGGMATHTFTMRHTLIPLDIVFFDQDGVGVGMLEMTPCSAEPCPGYTIDRPSAYALEVPAGSVELSPDSRLIIP